MQRTKPLRPRIPKIQGIRVNGDEKTQIAIQYPVFPTIAQMQETQQESPTSTVSQVLKVNFESFLGLKDKSENEKKIQFDSLNTLL